jgi:Tol biopolymer transport system component
MEGVASPIWSRSADALFVTAPPADLPGEAPQVTRLPLATGRVERPKRKDGPQYATDTTPDGGVIFTINRGRDSDVELLDGSGLHSTPLLSSPFNESDGALSPDGRWLAFQADDSGRDEIYVQPFRREGERSRVSTDGGGEPRWSVDGSELYFLSAAGMLNAVPVDASGHPGAPSALFPINSAGMLEQKEFGLTHYDVGAAKDRFLVRELPNGVDDPPIVIIVRR